MRKDILEAMYMMRKEEKICYATVARQYDCDPRTVKRYFEKEAKEVSTRKSRTIKRKTDSFEEIIKDKFLRYHSSAKSIYTFLRKEYGYDGSYSTIKRYVHKLKDEQVKVATVRFETVPGLQCQIDWKEEFKLELCTGEIVSFNIFLSILGYSRLKYIELTQDRSQATLFRCLTNAIKYFKGVPKEFLFDNMRSVVDRSRTQFGKAVYNETFEHFAKDANFIPVSCVAYRPQTKGKVESVAHLIDRLKVYNNELSSLEEIEALVKLFNEEINNEINSTTGEKPIQRFLRNEKEHLTNEPNYQALYSYFSSKPLARKVSKDALVTFNNAKYSVDPKFVNKTVTLEVRNNKLYISYGNKFICFHELQNKKFNYLEEHYTKLMEHSIANKDAIETLCKQNLKMYDEIFAN